MKNVQIGGEARTTRGPVDRGTSGPPAKEEELLFERSSKAYRRYRRPLFFQPGRRQQPLSSPVRFQAFDHQGKKSWRDEQIGFHVPEASRIIFPKKLVGQVQAFGKSRLRRNGFFHEIAPGLKPAAVPKTN